MFRLSLNLIWPAIYVAEHYEKLWYIVIGTIVLEAILVFLILKIDWVKSLTVSLLGNILSGVLGTFLMMYGMIFWHAMVDSLMPHATFDYYNWVATFILMCLGSVAIEVFAAKLYLKAIPLRKLFFPLLAGNVLTYVLIAFVMNKEHEAETVYRYEKYLYQAVPNQLTLFKGEQVRFDSSFVKLEYNSEGKRLGSGGYTLEIYFSKDYPNEYNFELNVPDAKSGQNAGLNVLQKDKVDYFRKTIQLEDIPDSVITVTQLRNPDTSIGWTGEIQGQKVIFYKKEKQSVQLHSKE